MLCLISLPVFMRTDEAVMIMKSAYWFVPDNSVFVMRIWQLLNAS